MPTDSEPLRHPRGGAASGAGTAPTPQVYRRAAYRSLGWGILAALGLSSIYLTVVSAVNSFDSAISTFRDLWPWMVPLVTGFALQAGLFAYGSQVARAGASPHASGVVASGGASTLSMIACCSHYLANVLPFLGATGLAMVLSGYQRTFLLAGVLSNAVGIVYLLGAMGQHKLYDPHGRTLPRLFHWPVHRAVPYAAAVAADIFATAILLEGWK